MQAEVRFSLLARTAASLGLVIGDAEMAVASTARMTWKRIVEDL